VDIGVVTSGNFSPTLGVGIALALVTPECAAVGSEVILRVRDSDLPARVVERPFVRR
jgi:aminomethyltransferase